MTTTVRVACPSGAGVRIKYGTQVAEVPVGGVHTFYVYDGQSAEIYELGSDSAKAVDALSTLNTQLIEEVSKLRAELEAVKNAVQDA